MNEILHPRNSGYLLENFRLFHLRDQLAQTVDSHYHEFDKALVHYSGTVDYIVEGISYHLQPGDILFVRHNDIHRPVISPNSIYERAVFWIKPGFIEENSTDGQRLETCFNLSSEKRSCLYRPSPETRGRIKKLIAELENALKDDSFGSDILCNTYFLQLMVEFNRCVLNKGPQVVPDVDPRMDEVIRFINNNLDEELSVDTLAAMCYLSRYYFMRRFKEATGYTVHNYIQQKRVTAAAELLDGGLTISEAAACVGFSDYSAFLRAFKKVLGLTPSDYMQQREQSLEGAYRE